MNANKMFNFVAKNKLEEFRFLSLIIWIYIVYVVGYKEIWENFFLSVTMFFGAFIGSATPVGGGTIAFPVLTLVKHTQPLVAATYSLAIQSFGMTAASLAIIKRKVKIDKALLLASLCTSIAGYSLSFLFLKNTINPLLLKVFFSSFWMSFGIVLFLSRKIENTIYTYENSYLTIEKMVIFCLCSFVGGGITAWIGSGMDVIFFSLVILLFHTEEKVATSTSVLVMAGLSIFATVLNFITSNIPTNVYNYLSSTIPVVIYLAPAGAVFISKKTNSYVRNILYVLIVLQYIFTITILFHEKIILFSLVVILFSTLSIALIRLTGKRREISQ